ncbi:MAG TPA: hypothetical protein VMW87_05825, partial [Spirochaetia bacterium]|nr:hypothetical protein [Spirochaetia bacterium]
MCPKDPTGQDVCFIVPPHMLDQIAVNTQDPELRRRALSNIYLQGQLRGMRIGISQYAYATAPADK